MTGRINEGSSDKAVPLAAWKNRFSSIKDFGNAAFVQWVVDSYDLEYLTDPSLSIYAYELEPIIADSAEDPQFFLPPPPVFANPTTTTTTINSNSITRIKAW